VDVDMKTKSNLEAASMSRTWFIRIYCANKKKRWSILAADAEEEENVYLLSFILL